MKKISLNDYVKVRLTDRGRALYAKQLFQINQWAGHHVVNIVPKEVDEHGLTKFQLWEFMNLYGKELYNGQTDPVILPLMLYLDDENIWDVGWLDENKQ